MAWKEPPPPVYQPSEQSALLPSSGEPRQSPGHVSSSVPEAGKGSTTPSRTKRGIILVVLLLVGSLCGAWIDRLVAADPNDPRVRRRIMRQWDARMKKFQLDEKKIVERREQMNEGYKREEDEWRQKFAKFEEELKEKARREQREREQARLYWVNIQPDEHCISSGHKRYTAQLANLPESMDGVEACRATPFTINGVTYNTPLTCEDTGIGLSGGVFGSWVAEDEVACATYWEVVNRKDCTAPNSGFRRFEAKFGHVRQGEDVEMLCHSTPLLIYGRLHEHPVACPYLGIFAGHWGMWNIPDDSCR